MDNISACMNLKIVVTSLFAALATASLAAPINFDFKDPKGVNNAVFKLDAPLEAITGSANGIKGAVSFDPANPGATKGKIVIDSSSLKVGNPMMQEHMQSDKWLNVGKHPEITFETKELRNVKREGDVTTAEAIGTFTLKGVAKEIKAPIKLTYLKDKLAARNQGQKGDLLVIRSNFEINRSDFGIQAGQATDKVAETIDITLSIAGAAPR